MHKRILAICVAIFLALAVIPTGFADNSDQVVITYGETAYMNQQYKSIVDNYFAGKTNVNINDIDSKVITAGDVNKISGGFSGKQYNSNQIFSSALLDLNQNGEITVEVDNSITTITPEMYMSALKSAGIQGGHVYVTSPVSATGESALAGIMNCPRHDPTPDPRRPASPRPGRTQFSLALKAGLPASCRHCPPPVHMSIYSPLPLTKIPSSIRGLPTLRLLCKSFLNASGTLGPAPRRGTHLL